MIALILIGCVVVYVGGLVVATYLLTRHDVWSSDEREIWSALWPFTLPATALLVLPVRAALTWAVGRARDARDGVQSRPQAPPSPPAPSPSTPTPAAVSGEPMPARRGRWGVCTGEFLWQPHFRWGFQGRDAAEAARAGPEGRERLQGRRNSPFLH